MDAEVTTRASDAPTSRRTKRSSGPVSAQKALAVVAGAVALAVVLVHLGAPPLTTKPVVDPPFMTAPHHKVVTRKGILPAKRFHVLVADGSGTATVATKLFTIIKSAGWGVLTPVDAAAVVKHTLIYYATGKKSLAQAVAITLHLGASSITPISAAMPVSVSTGADVVVVVGTDQIPPPTTTTLPPSTTTSKAGSTKKSTKKKSTTSTTKKG